MNKNKLKDTLIAMEHKIIEEAEMNYEDYLTSNQVESLIVVDDEEKSMNYENTDLSNKLDQQIHEHEEHLVALNEIDFSPTDAIKPGAVVKSNGRYMFIGISKPKFKFGDKQFIGVSTDAPIYKCMAGKKAGETCYFNNISFKIEEVH